MKSFRAPPSRCLDCGKLLDMASGAGHRHKPRPGAITICFDCGHIMAFAADLRLRALTDREMVEIAGDPKLVLVQKARARYIAAHPRPKP